jgi:hypothetical protein
MQPGQSQHKILRIIQCVVINIRHRFFEVNPKRCLPLTRINTSLELPNHIRALRVDPKGGIGWIAPMLSHYSKPSPFVFAAQQELPNPLRAELVPD